MYGRVLFYFLCFIKYLRMIDLRGLGIQTFFRFVEFILNVPLHLRRPHSADILVYDSVNREIFQKILFDYSINFLSLRGESFNLPCFLITILGFGFTKEAYVDTYIRLVNPSCLITHIDNRISFLLLSSRHPNKFTILIQNGWRSYDGFFESIDKLPTSTSKLLHVDWMLLFNSDIAFEYSKRIKGNTLVIGSLLNNAAVKEESSDIDCNALVFISQFSDSGIYNGGRYIPHDLIFQQPDTYVLLTLQSYCRSFGQELVILKRCSESALSTLEDNYYKQILGKDINFFQASSLYSGYSYLDTCKVSVTIDSTLGYESLARGNRCVFLPVRGNYVTLYSREMGWPSRIPQHGFCWTNSIEESKCFDLLDFAFNASRDAWDFAYKNSPLVDLMAMDYGNTSLIGLTKRLI